MWVSFRSYPRSCTASAVKGTRLERSELELNEIEALTDCTAGGKEFETRHIEVLDNQTEE